MRRPPTREDDVALPPAAEGGGSVERALQAALAEVRREALSPRAMLKNWRLGRRYDLKTLGHADVDSEVPAGRRPDCGACTDSCCRGPGTAVPLRLVDIARLVDAGLGWAVVPRPEGSDDEDEGLRALRGLDAQRLFPTLARGPAGQCVFLDDGGRCGVYALRPLGCRSYPVLVDPARRRLRWASGCRSWAEDATPSEDERMHGAALEAYNTKVRDLVVLAHGRGALARAGLARYLPVWQAEET